MHYIKQQYNWVLETTNWAGQAFLGFALGFGIGALAVFYFVMKPYIV